MPQTIVDLSQSDRRVVPTLAHDLILGNPTQPVGERAGVASIMALKNIIGGFTPVSLGIKATVSAQVSTWRSTNLVTSRGWTVVPSGRRSARTSGKLLDERRSVAAVACGFCGRHAGPSPKQSRSRAVFPTVALAMMPC